MLGLKRDVNYLVDYDPAWPALYAAERARLAVALGDVALGIEHYGSTSVPGLRAKPILDILVGVEPLDNWALCREPLEALGYDYAEHAQVPNHYVFGRGRDRTERTHLVHVVLYGGPDWVACLAFREALRASPALQAQYVAMKEEAIRLAPTGRGKYTEIKGPFVARVVAGGSGG
jgi:GrpB-like predicted nucleotidyltransferase (UPF0157 family)